jgi:hypothetical protein
MAITAADIHFRLTTTAGTAGNQNAGTPAGSLGKYAANNDLTDATLHNLFDIISGDENAASTVDYRAVGIYNANAALTWQAPKAWISSETAGGASAALGADTTAASAIGSATAQLLQIANELTAPAGVTFTAPTTKTAGVALSDIAATFVKGLWVRRTAANTTPVDTDGAVVTVEGDTSA